MLPDKADMFDHYHRWFPLFRRVLTKLVSTDGAGADESARDYEKAVRLVRQEQEEYERLMGVPNER